MIKDILNFGDKNCTVKEFKDGVRQGVPLAIFGVAESFKHFLVSQVDCPVLYVVADDISANKVAQEISQFCGQEVLVLPPQDEILIGTKGFSKEMTYRRAEAIYRLSQGGVTVTTPEALMQLFPKQICTVSFEVDRSFDIDECIKQLVLMGYVRVDKTEDKGNFSLRGDILDVYPINSDLPYRIDFFDDTVESIRTFDIETGKKQASFESVTVIQATPCVFSDNELTGFRDELYRLVSRADKKAQDRLREKESDLLEAIERKDYDALTTLAPLSKNSTTFDKLLAPETLMIFDEPKKIVEKATLYQKEFDERFASLSAVGEVFEFAKGNLISFEDFKEKCMAYRECAMQILSSSISIFNPLKIINPVVSGVADYRLDFKELFRDVKNWLTGGYSVVVFASDMERVEKLSLDFSENGIYCKIGGETSKGVTLFPEKLEKGFVYHEGKKAVIGSGNLYAKPISERKIKPKNQKFFSAPEVGDYAVHEVHGIGKVLGNKKITTTEGTKDYVAIEYHGGDILYVPVESMDVLSRYVGGDKKPSLSRIGGKDFDRIKSRVKASIKAMSFDLKKLYEERNACIGFQYFYDEFMEKAFEDRFPFEDTPDQVVANQDIKTDMTSGKVMDRLVCGDVGFGKTEVSFRAAFRAITNGKQVAMLAPTTILAEQHYNTAVKRFKDFGVKIACLNRFRTEKQQRLILEGAKNGSIEFVIGTHRLLAKDVGFRDLGLLILDEEQRFGVEHKEKIKLMKKNVDTLTLTATPIPRTLHMSLSGIRSISTITTPPKKRLPVQTYVTEETDMLIRDAISREINRGGQAFILYNRVETINTFAEKIKRILPNVKITVAHGQMEERKLENSIMDFYNGKTDLLISTTIIENGLDLPKANTMIVIDADRLGLSTLYQLKGRVGRSDRLAYAYFTYKREKILTETAYKRLNAIVEFAEMGSGVKIAMRDLEIRGAGNVLGAEQHGHMDKIGYELYSKLLREELTGEEEIIPELDIRVTAYIPDGYVQSNSVKMSVYKEIAEIASDKDEKEVLDMLADTYGEIPLEIYNLINISAVKRYASKIKVSAINIFKNKCELVYDNMKVFMEQQLSSTLERFKGIAHISVVSKPTIEFYCKNRSNQDMLDLVKEFLQDVIAKKDKY